MRRTKPTRQDPEAFKTLTDASSTSTSDTEAFDTLADVELTPEIVAARQAAKNAPAVVEKGRPLPPKQPQILHKMEKRTNKGKDFWVCSGCGYSTYKASSAAEHDLER